MVDKRPLIILLHGAGASNQSAFLEYTRGCFESLGYPVRPYDFGYMQEAQATGKRRPPPKVEKLVEELRGLLSGSLNDSQPCVLVGKSMGGRVATMLAATDCPASVQAVAVLGYPFIGNGKNKQPRTGHFEDIKVPVLIQQGTRDGFGKPEDVDAMELPEGGISINWLPSGDHDFKPLRSSGFDQQQLIAKAVNHIDEWLKG